MPAHRVHPGQAPHGGDDGVINSPWFGPPRLNLPRPILPPAHSPLRQERAAPWILDIVGIDQSFVDARCPPGRRSRRGRATSAAPFRKILAQRDYAEPPQTLLDGSGAPFYVRDKVEMTASEQPDADELDASDPSIPPSLPPEALPDLSNPTKPQAAWLRKLYLPMHQHFHLVACQLDCKKPGPPRIDRKRVIAAGMVVRRLIADPHAVRWEDWIPSPHGDGILGVEIAHEDR